MCDAVSFAYFGAMEERHHKQTEIRTTATHGADFAAPRAGWQVDQAPI